jgi:hypothetical protein
MRGAYPVQSGMPHRHPASSNPAPANIASADAPAGPSFDQFHLAPAMLTNLLRLNYLTMTPNQEASLPLTLAGGDLTCLSVSDPLRSFLRAISYDSCSTEAAGQGCALGDSYVAVDRGRERHSLSPPSELGVQFSRDGLSCQLFPYRDWRANRWASDIVNSPRSAKKTFGYCL